MKKKTTGFYGALTMLVACLMTASPAGAVEGDILWEIMRGTRIETSPAIRGDGTIYFGSDDNRLYAVDRNGEEIWQFTAGDDIISSPAIGADGTIYFGSMDGFLFAIDTDGRQKWRHPTGGGIAFIPRHRPRRHRLCWIRRHLCLRHRRQRQRSRPQVAVPDERCRQIVPGGGQGRHPLRRLL